MQIERLSNGRDVRPLRKFHKAPRRQPCRLQRDAARQNITATAYRDNNNAAERVRLARSTKSSGNSSGSERFNSAPEYTE